MPRKHPGKKYLTDQNKNQKTKEKLKPKSDSSIPAESNSESKPREPILGGTSGAGLFTFNEMSKGLKSLITGRDTGTFSLHRLRQGNATKGHDILEKSLKVSKLSRTEDILPPQATQILQKYQKQLGQAIGELLASAKNAKPTGIPFPALKSDRKAAPSKAYTTTKGTERALTVQRFPTLYDFKRLKPTSKIDDRSIRVNKEPLSMSRVLTDQLFSEALDSMTLGEIFNKHIPGPEEIARILGTEVDLSVPSKSDAKWVKTRYDQYKRFLNYYSELYAGIAKDLKAKTPENPKELMVRIRGIMNLHPYATTTWKMTAPDAASEPASSAYPKNKEKTLNLLNVNPNELAKNIAYDGSGFSDLSGFTAFVQNRLEMVFDRDTAQSLLQSANIDSSKEALTLVENLIDIDSSGPQTIQQLAVAHDDNIDYDDDEEIYEA